MARTLDPCRGVAPALIDRALDCVSSGFHWDLGNIIAPGYASAVVGSRGVSLVLSVSDPTQSAYTMLSLDC